MPTLLILQQLDAGKGASSGDHNGGIDGAAGEVHGIALGRYAVDLRDQGGSHADENGALHRGGAAAVSGEGNGDTVVGAAGDVGQLREGILAGGSGAEVQKLAAAVGSGESELGGAVLAGAVVVVVQAAGRRHAAQDHILQHKADKSGLPYIRQFFVSCIGS